MTHLTVAQIGVLVFAGLIYGFTKTGIFGISVILTPVMLYFFTPGQALGIALPLLVFADFLSALLLRKSAKWKNVALALPWSLAGVLVGWRVLAYVQTLPEGQGNALLVRLISGVLVFVVSSGIVVRVWRSRAERTLRLRAGTAAAEPAPTAPRPVSVWRLAFGSFVAFVGGALTMISNNSGPAWVLYLILFRLDKYAFLGTAAYIIILLNLVKLPFSIQLGYVTRDTLLLNLAMAPLVVVGILAGRAVVKRISQAFFDNLTQGFALLGALYLLLR